MLKALNHRSDGAGGMGILKATPGRHCQLTDTARPQSLGYRHETSLSHRLQKTYRACQDGLAYK
jgi:hypothetical protein